MCGIIGVIGNEKASEIVTEGLNIIQDRGKDGFGVYNFSSLKTGKDIPKIGKSDKVIGHCLHSIVSYIPQPLNLGDSYLIINCEIYNWKQLAEKHNLDVKNDAELVLHLLKKNKIEKVLSELDGVYSFAYLDKGTIRIARDIFGVKPLWYSLKEGFYFCSEKKALEKQGIKSIEELNPRKILEFDIESGKTKFYEREFFDIKPEHKKKYEKIKKELTGYIADAIAKRIPNQKFGILFSGGVDSTLIALVCRDLGVDFTCYTAALQDGNMQTASDLDYSEKIAKKYGFKLKVQKLDIKETEKYIRKVSPLIEDNTVTKVGVALTFYAACKLAKKDKIKVMFSGLGSEEIFAGYERFRNSSNVNNECVSGLLKIYERDLYRDDTITMNNNIELRLPFLDKALVEYSLKIPGKFKLTDEGDKLILRDVAHSLGLAKEYAYRKKVAAQYGSKFSRAIEKLAKKSKASSQAEYLAQFYKKPNVKLAALVSGGKDGMFAAYLMHVHNYSVECFVSIKSENPHSYMYHTPNIDLVELQAEAAEKHIIIEQTAGKKEEELKSLKRALQRAKEEYGVEGIVSGAIFSNYQRERIDKVCDSIGLKNFVPIWHMDQELEMRQLLKNNFSVVLSSIACDGLDKSWLGKVITPKDVDKLVDISKKIGINVAGEGGEFESLVLDCPLFSKRIEIKDYSIEMEKEYCGKFLVKEAKLVSKE